MTALANAFRRAFGQPEDNTIGSAWEQQQQESKRREKLRPVDDPEDPGGRFGYGEHERVNDYGFKELGFWDNAYGTPRWFPICAYCGSLTTPNRGQGMICSDCDHQFLLDMSHDDYL